MRRQSCHCTYGFVPFSALGVCALFMTAPALAGVPEYTNATSVRLDSAWAGDTEEKDFAFGDVDKDNDIDLVMVRKQPFTTSGGQENVLLMNVNGVLTDQTAAYIPEFADLTNDRDVLLVDVNNDTWLDIVTAAACNFCNTSGVAAESRLYLNLGESAGNWLGFGPPAVLFNGNNFCHVGAGDITADGYQDLYFVTYRDDSANQQSGNPNCSPSGAQDTEDQLMVNGGAGDPGCYTVDNGRMVAGFRPSGFGSATFMADMNGDNTLDVVKSENGPAKIAYNPVGNEGFFNDWETVYGGAAYHVGGGDLNNDDKLDLIISDDGNDKYMINTGNGGDGMANFSTFTFPGPTGGFGSDSYIVDLDGDGWSEVIICDVDVDAPGCSRVSEILSNNNGSFTHETESSTLGNSNLTGVHDIAVFDIDGDDALDMVVGRCVGTQVWMNSPPIGLEFAYPSGLPSLVTPNATTDFTVDMTPFGDTIDNGTETLYVSVNGGGFVPSAMTDNGGGNYTATLPAAACTDQMAYYVSAQLDGGLTFTDPATAPGLTHAAVAAEGTITFFEDDIEGDVTAAGWTVVNDASLTSGGWEQAVPIGTFFSGGIPAAPNADATPSPGTMAFVTQNSSFVGEAYGLHDVDGGPTNLISPIIDLTDSDAFISYNQWMFHDGIGEHELMRVSITNDAGANWVTVDNVDSTGGQWVLASFFVGDYVTPTSQVQVRFSLCDCPNDSVAEAGIDDFKVEELVCAACPWDVDSSGAVDVGDLLAVLGAWGPNPGHPADFDGNGSVDVGDLLKLLGFWGPCP